MNESNNLSYKVAEDYTCDSLVEEITTKFHESKLVANKQFENLIISEEILNSVEEECSKINLKLDGEMDVQKFQVSYCF